jgi:phage terminase large subunit-like protein
MTGAKLITREDAPELFNVIEEVVAFPVGEHDDYVDTMTQALLRFRNGGFIALPSDEPDEPVFFKSNRRSAYY